MGSNAKKSGRVSCFVFRFWKSSLLRAKTCATLIKILKFYSSSSRKYRTRTSWSSILIIGQFDRFSIRSYECAYEESSCFSSVVRSVFASFSFSRDINRSAIFLDNNYPGKGIHRNWIFFTGINPSFLGFIESRGPLVLPLVRGGQFKAALKRLARVWQRESQPTFSPPPPPSLPSPRSLLLSIIRKSHRLFTL